MIYEPESKNILIYGDNKLVMDSLINQNWTGKINLIYIDPPFFTGNNFTINKEIAYRDTWNNITFYLEYMHERLVLMKELLADNGSIYVHLDWHAVHYVKVIMDDIFGYDNFRNEIVWCYRTGGASSKKNGFSKKHDTILLYSKNANFKFNKLKERVYYDKPFFTSLKDANGRYYADVFLRDVLQDKIKLVCNNEILTVNVKPVINVSSECLNFQTQKTRRTITNFDYGHYKS